MVGAVYSQTVLEYLNGEHTSVGKLLLKKSVVNLIVIIVYIYLIRDSRAAVDTLII